MTPISQDRYKLRQLILYIAWRMREAEYLGSTKLNKVLYRSEFTAFRELGRKLTSFKYQKNQLGPTLSAYMHVTRELADEGLLTWETRARGTRDEQRPIVENEPETDVFTPEELAIINREIALAWPLTAKQISAEEHRTAAWYATRMNDVIMPELSFVEDPGTVISLSDADHEWAGQAIQRYLARANRI